MSHKFLAAIKINFKLCAIFSILLFAFLNSHSRVECVSHAVLFVFQFVEIEAEFM
jgi:hypothetical protein